MNCKLVWRQNVKEKKPPTPRVKPSHFYHVLTLSPDVHKTLRVTSCHILVCSRAGFSVRNTGGRRGRAGSRFVLAYVRYKLQQLAAKWYRVVAPVAHTWRRLSNVSSPPETRPEVLFLDWASYTSQIESNYLFLQTNLCYLCLYVYVITTQCMCGESSRAAPPTCGVVMQ